MTRPLASQQIEANLLFADWPAPAGVRALTTLRGPWGCSAPPYAQFNLGLRCGDNEGAVLANRASLAAGLHGVRQIGWLAQVHGTKVHEFGLAEQEQTPPTADAAACTSPGMALAILTADCLPVLLCRRDGRAVGAAHAGWRGLLAGVIENTAQRLGSGVELMAWLGPAAGPERYEVGAEVREAFVAVDAQVQDCFKPSRPGHFLMDMYALARMRLQHIGVNAVYGGGLCTIGDADRFYSYRRHAQTGRMASLIWIESEQAKPV